MCSWVKVLRPATAEAREDKIHLGNRACQHWEIRRAFRAWPPALTLAVRPTVSAEKPPVTHRLGVQLTVGAALDIRSSEAVGSAFQ
jgi:hypothetical protein